MIINEYRYNDINYDNIINNLKLDDDDFIKICMSTILIKSNKNNILTDVKYPVEKIDENTYCIYLMDYKDFKINHKYEIKKLSKYFIIEYQKHEHIDYDSILRIIEKELYKDDIFNNNEHIRLSNNSITIITDKDLKLNDIKYKIVKSYDQWDNYYRIFFDTI